MQVDNADWDIGMNHFNHEMKDGLARLFQWNVLRKTAILYYNIVVDLTWILCYLMLNLQDIKR